MDRQSPIVKKLSRALLATTCLTGAAGIAGADTIIEGQGLAPADFGNTFGTAFLLPVGTTSVQGTIRLGIDGQDWFEFQSLPPGEGFDIHPFDITGIEAAHIDVVNSSQTILAERGVETGGNHVTGIVPGDGKLFVEVFSTFGERNYEVDLVAPTGASAPEPATLPAAGLALAGALAWRRRRKQSA